MAAGLAESSPAMTPVPSAALVASGGGQSQRMIRPTKRSQPCKRHSFTTSIAVILHGQGEMLRRLGHLAKARGHLKESREFYMNARSCFRKIDDHYAEAAVLLDLGQVLESLDEHDAASAAYRDANRALLDVAMNSGDRHNDIQAHAAD